MSAKQRQENAGAAVEKDSAEAKKQPEKGSKTGYRQAAVFGERGNQLRVWSEAPSGTRRFYYTVPDKRLPSGSRTRSLRTSSEEEAIKWAEGVIKSGISFDDIPEIAADAKLPTEPGVKKPPPKKKTKGRATAKKARKKS